MYLPHHILKIFSFLFNVLFTIQFNILEIYELILIWTMGLFHIFFFLKI